MTRPAPTRSSPALLSRRRVPVRLPARHGEPAGRSGSPVRKPAREPGYRAVGWAATLLALIGAGGLPGEARAQEAEKPGKPGPIYTGLRGFAVFGEGFRFPANFPGRGDLSVKWSQAIAFGGELQVGYHLPLVPLRVELDLGLIHAPGESLATDDLPRNDSPNGVNTTYAHLTGWYRLTSFPIPILPGGALNLDIGGGLGPALVSVNSLALGGQSLRAREEAVMSYQGGLSFSISLGERWEVSADYRYFATNEFPLNHASPGTLSEADLENHSLGFGFRYRI